MATVDEILATMTNVDVAKDVNEVLVIDPNTRQINIPGSELIFGVTSDENAERKYFLCPRYVGNGLDLTSCFLRVNYRNANGEIDAHLISDVALTEDGENITFSWELARKVTQYKGQVAFVVCACRPGDNGKLLNEWNTTHAMGSVLDGLEPTNVDVTGATTDVIAQLITMVEAQTVAVESEGGKQIKAVQTAAQTAQSDAVAQIEAKGVNTRNSIPADYTALSEAVDGLVRGRAGAIVCSAEGSAVAVNDASDMKIQGLRIFGRSTQDGTPTPEAPVEIKSVDKPVVSVYGKNLCNMKAFDSMGMNGTANTYDANTHTITMTADSTTSAGRYGSPVNVLPVGKKCTVSFDIRGTSGKKVNCGWDKAKTSIILTDDFVRYSSTLVITNKREAISFYTVHVNLGGLAAGEYMQFANVQVEYGDTATEYEEYQTAQTVELTHTLPGIPVTFGGNYTDSDGRQWICDEVDLERGVYVQRINSVTYDGADETWALNQLGSFARFTAAREDIKNSSERTGFLCTRFTSEDITTDRVGLCFIGTSTPGQFYFYPNTDITTVDQWKEWLMQNPITVYFALATPIETTLSETEIAAYRAMHSNYPNTTVLNDAGAHIVVKYAADTKLYIDNKIATLVGGV